MLCIRCSWTSPPPIMCYILGPLRCIHPKCCFSSLEVKAQCIHWNDIPKVLRVELLCKHIIACFMLLENKNISWRTGLQQNDNYSVTCISWDTYLFWKKGGCKLIDTFASNGCFLFKHLPCWGKNWNAAQDVKYWCSIIQTRKLWCVSLLFNHAKSRSARGINDRTIGVVCI